MTIEYRRRVAYVQRMIVWDGTDDTADEIKAWVGIIPDGADSGFFTPAEAYALTGEATPHALLWVEHSQAWIQVPYGTRVVQELDGNGFYPIDPAGLRAGFERELVTCTCPDGSLHPQQAWTAPNCGIHNAPKPPRPSA